MNTKQKFQIKKLVKELESIRGRHTELVTVYIPAGYDLNKIINHLAQEQGTASNIKDKTTRDHVIDSLEKMIRHLRLFKRTPENGLAVFSGNASEKESKVDLKVWSIEPPLPIKTRMYRCDQTFVTDILKSMIESKDLYALIVVDRRDGTVGVLKGSAIDTLSHLTSGVPGKFKAGGQCHPFGTIIQSSDGEILKIEKSHNPYKLKSVDFNNLNIKDSPITDKWETGKKEAYKITTKYPQLVVESSKDHIYFVSTEKGIIEKSAQELKEGDSLLMPERLEIKGKIQKLNSKQFYNSFIINKKGREILKKKRLEKGLFQKELAKKIGAMQATISSYELGKINSNKNQLDRLCDYLKIDFNRFLEKYTAPYKRYNKIKLPDKVTPEFAQFLGYLIGDGSMETDRITFFEQRKEVASKYKEKFDKYFNIKSSYRFRERKNYHQLRFTSRPLVRLIKAEFPEIKKALDTEIPKKILQSKNNVLAHFLSGLFDAEGYLMQKSVGIATSNEILVRQIQMTLLRFSILSSFYVYDNKKNPYSNKPIYKLQINDKQSLLNFQKFIDFTSTEKSNKLKDKINKKSNKNSVRQILAPGSKIRKMIEEYGYQVSNFSRVSNFFRNNRMMSKGVFKNSIMDCVKNRELHKKLEVIYSCPLLPVKIHKIDKSNRKIQMIDISVKNQNFIANGIIVHNSAHRFERMIEGMAKEFFKRIAEVANKEFLPMKTEIKGVLVGGPGHTKNEFLDTGYLNNELKQKVISVQDLSYTGDFGLHELVDKSKDAISDAEITKEKKIMQRFFEMLAKEANKVTYGIKEVEKALEMKAVDTLLISEAFETEKVEELEEKGSKEGAKVEIISIESREGAQLKELGGVAAILRYPIE